MARDGVGVMVLGLDFETGRMASNRGWSRSGGHEQNLWMIRPGVQTSHDDTILVFAAPSVCILAIWVSLQYRSRSTGLNDRGI